MGAIAGVVLVVLVGVRAIDAKSRDQSVSGLIGGTVWATPVQ